ncbi:MAG: hypothetical protein WAP74_02830 [Patescibacteria group bacterium]
MVILGFLSTLIFVSAQAAHAEPTQYCDGSAPSRFTLQNATITHSCGNDFRTVQYRFVAKVKATELATITFLSPVPFAETAAGLLNRPADYEYSVYKIQTNPPDNFYIVADIPDSNLIFGLWTDRASKNFNSTYSESNFRWHIIQNAKYFDLPTFAGLTPGGAGQATADASTIQFINRQTDTQLRQYLRYVESRNDWALTNPEAGSELGPAGCAHRHQVYIDSLKYFDSGNSTFLGTRPIQLDTRGAYIDIPPAPASTNLRRPALRFRYKYYMIYTETTRAGQILSPVATANYFYFFPDPPGNHCNLALRLSDSTINTIPIVGSVLGDIGGQAAVLTVSVNRVQGNKIAISDSEQDQFGSVVFQRDSFIEFIKKLYGGKSPYDSSFTSNDKRTQNTAATRQDPDELGAIRILSNQNLDASTGGGSTCPPELNKLPYGLGGALCGVADLVMGVAVSFANLSFSLLLKAATLQ